MSTAPPLGLSRSPMQLSNEDLPQPLGPVRATICPGGTSKDTPLQRTRLPKALRSSSTCKPSFLRCMCAVLFKGGSVSGARLPKQDGAHESQHAGEADNQIG